MNNQKTSIRVRFAPSPTGIMHLGNVRTALLNYLFSQQKQGTFVLRIEDTDPDRNFDPNAHQIMEDLAWLGLTYSEGGTKGGPYSPYYQSQRTELYQEQLDVLKEKNVLYRCFCTPELLERKRVRSLALKIAPRYDRTCLKLSPQEIQNNLENGVLFIWRFKIPENYIATVHDLAHGAIQFDLNHFSDFPVSRSDGTFTFIFANCVDDILMKMTYVLRGEDHLSNTANQVLLYETFGVKPPLFWHLPIICNVDGKKLSKRDFGFSLNDLKNNGFLPEAITNYLAIIGGSFAHEIMDMKSLVQAMNFDHIKPISNIRYDVEKLKWVNHKWIQQYDPEKLTHALVPYLESAYPQIKKLEHAKLVTLIQTIKSELTTLNDSVAILHFYFEEPIITQETVLEHIPTDLLEPMKQIIKKNLETILSSEQFLENLKQDAKKSNIHNKLLFTILRLALTGNIHGPAIKDIITILGLQESKKRIEKFL
jgi:nondiscriminating glutamyl-tRNA synthetase